MLMLKSTDYITQNPGTKSLRCEPTDNMFGQVPIDIMLDLSNIQWISPMVSRARILQGVR
ncbi:hypothetical protein Plhal304r1_c100g0174661 [Plasmopara halstedii]